jgi:superfamily II DNA helicase RecQ
MATILSTNNPEFKSMSQKHSMLAILNSKNEKNGLCILPTNSGKSLLYMVPSLCWAESVTVVVMPLKSLLLGMFY